VGEPLKRNVMRQMNERSCTLVEVPVEGRLWPDHDLIVRVMESPYYRRGVAQRSFVLFVPED
jgi:hypothetical protein